VLELSGVRAVFWLQGINDFSDNGHCEADAASAAVRSGVARLRERGFVVIGATVPSALNATRAGHGSALQDARRRAFNARVRSGELFDRYADIDAALTDPVTGRLRQGFNGDSTLGEPGDGVHPNRAGHAAIARCVFARLA
jgi:lysophospholipase L1-like esterase